MDLKLNLPVKLYTYSNEINFQKKTHKITLTRDVTKLRLSCTMEKYSQSENSKNHYTLNNIPRAICSGIPHHNPHNVPLSTSTNLS